MKFWQELVEPLLATRPTPFYLFSSTPLVEALRELEAAFPGLPVQPWLSCKTQPLWPLLRWWQRQDRRIEVVSEFEFLAARAAGFAPDSILVNGPAKHHWLPRHSAAGLGVHFDSAAEAQSLAPMARRQDWTCGLRILTQAEFDPESPGYPTQFGLTPAEAVPVLRQLQRDRVRLETLHFHLRTNVASAECYGTAVDELVRFCRRTGFAPRHLDCGGGFPAPDVYTREGARVDDGFDLKAMARIYERALAQLPSVREIWLENGRWLSARSGVLVTRILDSKERRGMRHLLCDGGRTLHAMVSTWERHRWFALPQRRGRTTLTTVTGPTCMAFDQLLRGPLPRALQTGDHLVWRDAGAYHVPWETRFSHGAARIYWHDGRRVRQVRGPERFEDWLRGLGASPRRPNAR